MSFDSHDGHTNYDPDSEHKARQDGPEHWHRPSQHDIEAAQKAVHHNVLEAETHTTDLPPIPKFVEPAHKVQARFYLQQVSKTAYHGGEKTVEAVNIRLCAVKGEPFGTATPQGQIEALIVNPDAAKVFLDAPINQEFDILISPVAQQD